MEKNTAVKVLTEAGFVPVYGGEDYSDTPVGTIYSVTPSAGTKVEKGTQVYYFVSKGSSSGQTDPETAETMNRRYRQGIYKICKVKL